MKRIDILLAAYNGQEFIEDQINSILAQSFKDWRLIIRDDGSSDQTVPICQAYARRYPEQVCLADDALGNLGVFGCFEALLKQAQSEYIMLCDQDDVWLPNKIAVTLARLKEAETAFGNDLPLLAYTDHVVVDKELNVIHRSFYKYSKRTPRSGNDVAGLCMAGIVYGNTVMFNQRLRNLWQGFPKSIWSHDWWLAMIAATFGRLIYVDKATVLFRRHGRNTSGLKAQGFAAYLNRPNIFQGYRDDFRRMFRQHRLFYETYQGIMSESMRRFFAEISDLPSRNWVMRRYLILKHRLFKTGLLKNLGMLLLV